MAWLIAKWFLFLLLSFGLGALAGWGWRREQRREDDTSLPREMAVPDLALAERLPDLPEAVDAVPGRGNDGDEARLAEALETRDAEWNARVFELERGMTRREAEFMGERQKWSQDATLAAENLRRVEAEKTAEMARSADLTRRLAGLEIKVEEYIVENDRLRALATPPAPPVRDDRDFWRADQAEKRARFLELRLAAMVEAQRMQAENAEPKAPPTPAPAESGAEAGRTETGSYSAQDPALVLAWRERYYAARLRRLEADRAARADREATAQREIERLSAALAASGGEASEAVGLFAHAAEEAEEEARRTESAPAPEPAPLILGAEAIETARRLKWRNKYLESRVGLLERLASPVLAPEVPDAGRAAPPEWESERDRLRWRNLFLQGRLGQLLATRSAGSAMAAPRTESPESTQEPLPEPAAEPVEQRPPALNAPRDDAPDDLQRIVGVGPVNEAKLHALGIYHFDQIANWTPANVAWVESHLHFPGRIGREEWIVQARRFNSAGQAGRD